MSVSFSVLLLLAIAASCSALDHKIDCPEGKYYDHGVQNCEPCDDYCRYTSLPSYVQLCEENCPKVYKQLGMDEQKKTAPVADFLSDADKPPVSDDSTFPLGGKVALGIIGTLAVVATVVVGIVVFKKVQQKKAATQNHRRNGAATENNREYRYSGVEEENGDQAESERLSQGEGLLASLCDPRVLFNRLPLQETGQQGRNEIAIGGSNESVIQQETSRPKTLAVTQTPIFKPSGAMNPRLTRV